MERQSHAAEQLRLIRALYPALAERYAAGAGAEPSSSARFDAWLDTEAGALHAGAAFGGQGDAAVTERFGDAFRAAQRVAAVIGVAVPEPEAFAAAGVDLLHLGHLLGAQPELTPVPAPYGLGASRWHAAFAEAAQRHPEVLAAGPAVTPLVLGAEAARGFAELDRIPESAIALPSVAQRDAAGGTLRWTLRLVPAGSTPSVLGLGFAHGPHVSLPEMLMLQLMRITGGEEPVDTGTFTWLAGTVEGGRLAARHVYDAGDQVIRITCREIGNQGPHLGARPPLA